MATNTSKGAAIKSTPLTRTDFVDVQDMFDEFCRRMEVSFDAADPAIKGDKGEAGPPLDPNIIERDIASGQTSVDMGVDVEQFSVNLVNNEDTSPTIHIMTIDGNIVRLSGATPNANYRIVAVSYAAPVEE